MIRFLRTWFLFQKNQAVLYIAVVVALFAGAAGVALHSEIEAFPELTNVQVQVITLFPGKASEEVERQVTIPVEVAANGTPGLINQRSVSLFGLSVVTLTFADDVALKEARLAVSQRLGEMDLPEGIKPTLSPESTPIGEVFRYSLQGDLPVDELRLIEDWTLEREFKSLPGVADVVSFGGPRRTIEVRLNVPRMTALGLTVSGVAQALGQNHVNAGGSVITRGEEAFLIRSLGLYEKPEDLEYAVVGTQDRNIPIQIRDIGHVRISHDVRLGQVGVNNNDDAVTGIILLRKGADTLATCAAVRKKIEILNAAQLPAGARIIPIYDRTTLIERSSHTVFHNICFGILLVCLLLSLGLGFAYWSLTLAVALIIPFSLLMAFVGMKFMGYSPNLISLGAVDFGIMVETAVFAVESIIYHVGIKRKNDSETVIEALEEVIAPALLCAFLLIIAFIPILSLGRVEGRIFRPLGITLISALIGGQVGAILFIPFLSRWIPAGYDHPAPFDPLFSHTLRMTESVARRLADVKGLAVWCAAAFGGALVLLNWGLGREFLPTLNEGALWVRTTAPATISREASVELAGRIRRKLKEIPEVTDIVSQTGRPDDGTDVNGFDTTETFVQLIPPAEWRTARTLNGLIEVAQEKLKSLHGIESGFSQPIKDNVDEAISGVKGELVVKIYGPKLEQLQEYANRVGEILKKIPGSEDVFPEELFGQPELRFTMDHNLLARYGIRATDAEDVLETALLGKFAAKMIDENQRYIDVRIKPDLPDPPTAGILTALPVLAPNGAQIPLGQVSSLQLTEGVARIFRETGERRCAVRLSVRGRSVVEFVQEATRRVKAEAQIKPPYRFIWSGSFENAQRASQQLLILVPLCLLVMVIILFSWFGRWHTVGLLLWEIPFALVGGLAALRILGLYLSISAAVGGVVLVGVTFLTGMMLLSGWVHFKNPWEALQNEGKGILLSSGVAIVGLIPASFSHGIGSEIARPFAVMILGGLTSSLFFSLTILPALLSRSGFRNSTKTGM